MNEPQDPLLTVNQIAAELRVTPLTVRRWVDDGQLEAVRLGSHAKARVRVHRSALDRFLRPAGNRITTTLRPTRVDERGKGASLR